jgi:hypothetical protein
LLFLSLFLCAICADRDPPRDKAGRLMYCFSLDGWGRTRPRYRRGRLSTSLAPDACATMQPSRPIGQRRGKEVET